MKLSTRSKEYIIPEYSLTGDLLSFLTCNLQYRYQNKGNLPPSMPIQLWFGEFIHGVMEEAYIQWNNFSDEEKMNFPWDWEEKIKPIEDIITKRLKVKGLNPPNDYIYNYGPKENMYSARVDRSINIWGPHLFPLIEDAEVLIKGIRDMPIDKEGNARSEYYSINGVIDVLSSLKLDEISSIINDANNNFLYGDSSQEKNSEEIFHFFESKEIVKYSKSKEIGGYRQSREIVKYSESKSIKIEKPERAKKTFQQTLDNFLVISSDDINNAKKESEYSDSKNDSDINSIKSDTSDSNKNRNVNKILEYLANDEEFNNILKNFEEEEYEIIIDYKGMRRPSAPNKKDLNKTNIHLLNDDSNNESSLEDYKTWIQHEWQILTYAWLRSMQEDAKPVICGIIFYLNELVPSTGDLVSIREDIRNNKTDIPMDSISKEDWELLDNWDEDGPIAIHDDLSNKFKMDRSIRIINIKEELIDDSLLEFDEVVNQIESSMIQELNGSKIKEAWKADAEERTCTACDFRTFCNKKDLKEDKNSSVFTVP